MTYILILSHDLHPHPTDEGCPSRPRQKSSPHFQPRASIIFHTHFYVYRKNANTRTHTHTHTHTHARTHARTHSLSLSHFDLISFSQDILSRQGLAYTDDASACADGLISYSVSPPLSCLDEHISCSRIALICCSPSDQHMRPTSSASISFYLSVFVCVFMDLGPPPSSLSLSPQLSTNSR